jgi:hypothetical protein
MNKDVKELLLIHGIKNKDNKLIKRIKLRSLDGFDEEFLNAMESEDLLFPFKTSQLLSRIVSFGNERLDENDKLAMVKKMTIGDRIFLILQLRQLTFGDILQIDIKCGSCEEVMAIDLSVTTLLDHSLSKLNGKYVLDEDTGLYDVEFSNFHAKIRLPNGLDQEYISLHDIDELRLLQSCIVNLDSIGHEKLTDQEFKGVINLALSELDPLSDILLTVACPSCNASFSIPFIVEDFFFKEINSRKNILEFEVHWLALNYHWSESEILSLPISKRKSYVKLLDNALLGK